MYRNTFVSVDLENLKFNIKEIIKAYNTYDYYFAVVKANSYSHDINLTLNTIIESGCNYLAVATLEESLLIRDRNLEIPILCLEPVALKDLEICENNNITITVTDIDYLEKIKNSVKIHLKINTGMNRLGISDIEKFKNINKYIQKLNIEGIYTHMYEGSNKQTIKKQLDVFEQFLQYIDNVRIIHAFASEAIETYDKPSYINGCRLGIIMYGFSNYLKLKSTFELVSEVIQINKITNDTIGYNADYKTKGEEYIAVVPIGYADGIIRRNKNRFVYINNKPYQIVGNICMDMLFVKVDETIKNHDKVLIIKDNEHIKEIAKHLDTINYEVFCSITDRVPRIKKSCQI